ncbi:MAG: hypothetical protein EPO24_07680 [Bacteroidetes bacterium]|nr:MAG: hypothetical protein EPO24_07680 [Bacteroidota bacterium]
MNDFQKYIDNPKPMLDPENDFPVKNDTTVLDWLRVWWGAAFRYSYGIERVVCSLGKQYGWDEVFEVIKLAATNGKFSVRYVEVSCEKRAKQRKEKSEAQTRKIVHCPKCYEGYWSDRRHECAVTVFDSAGGGSPLRSDMATDCREESQEEVHEQVMKIKAAWSEPRQGREEWNNESKA